jgi:hypothetical protein
MKRGLDGTNERVFDYVYGRIERDIEQVCITTGIPFHVIAQRIGELLHPLGTPRVEGEVPLLRSTAAPRSTALATLEVALDTHHHAASPNTSVEVQDYRRKARAVKWTAKRRKEQAARAKLLNEQRRKKNAAKKKAPHSRDDKKQLIYQTRHALRKQGVPEEQLPPLPGKAA